MTNQTLIKKTIGGARPGAGRPKGSVSKISCNTLLAQIEQDARGKNYEEILVDDFMAARRSGDVNLIYKYHTLILSKVMNTLARVEVEDSSDTVLAKQQAFAEALSKLTGTSE